MLFGRVAILLRVGSRVPDVKCFPPGPEHKSAVQGDLLPCKPPWIFRFRAKVGRCKLPVGQPEDKAQQGCNLSAALVLVASCRGNLKGPLEEAFLILLGLPLYEWVKRKYGALLLP